MKRTFVILMLMLSTGWSAMAQTWIQGLVVDSATGIPMSLVSIKNFTTQDGTTTDRRGNFRIQITKDNYIRFTYKGYKDYVLRCDERDDKNFFRIRLTIREKALPEVVIKQPWTQYQLDSIRRSEIYEEIYEYKSENSIQSPVSLIYQKFSKRHKAKRHIRDQIVKDEKQKFIDTKYVPETVSRLTKLKGDELAYFMNDYPMEYQFARTASELEVNYWILQNFEDYQKQKKKQRN